MTKDIMANTTEFLTGELTCREISSFSLKRLKFSIAFIENGKEKKPYTDNKSNGLNIVFDFPCI